MTQAVDVGAGSLVVDGLTWRPHGRREPTLAEVSFTVSPGERVLLVGASGSGKSTLLRALAGLLDESLGERAGTVTLGEETPDTRPGAVGLLLQDPLHSVVAEYAGRDAAFGPENRQLPRSEILAKATQALDEVGFPYGADRRAMALSGGELARLSLAGAVALDPQVLLLDEPTAMLDPTSAGTVRAAVARSVEARGLTLVVVEHRLEDWVEICPRLVVLDQGRVLTDGPTTEVLRAQRDRLLAAGVWVPGAPPPVPSVSIPVPGQPPPVPGKELTGSLKQRRPYAAGLRLKGVSVTTPGAGPVLVRDLDLELGPGDGAAIVGPSGVGKSTLLRSVAGLRAPAAGTATLATPAGWRAAGEVARSSPDLAATLGWLTQHSEQSITRRTVEAEVLATGEALTAADPAGAAATRTRAAGLLDVLGLAHLREADPYQLSGGEQRRVALAAAVAHDPGLLLLDEPTVGQDRHTWAAVVGVIEAARRDGAAVLATTHDDALTARLGRSVPLVPGPTEASAVPDHRPRPVIETGGPPAARCNPVALLAAAAGAAVGSFWVNSALVGGLTLLASVLLSPLAVRRVRPALIRLAPVALAAVTVGWSTLLFSRYGWFAPQAYGLAAKEVTRILCLVVPGALVVSSLRPSSLGDALAQRLHLPHRPVAAATAALLRLEQLFDAWRTMTELRRVRGLAPGRSLTARVRATLSLTVALLVGALRSAQSMALSMDARGFAGAYRRTYALDSPWAGRDWVCCGLGVLLGILPMLLNRLL